MQWLLLSILFLVIGIVFNIIYDTLRHGIGPNPTSKKVKQTLFLHLPKIIEGTIIDLGSGFGTLTFPLAKIYPNCTVIGYENSLVPYFFSKLRLALFPQKNLKLIKIDFFNVSLNDASMIVCYLYPKAMKRLKQKFTKELKQGTWVVTHTFAIPDWKAKSVIECPDIYRTKIYIYKT